MNESEDKSIITMKGEGVRKGAWTEEEDALLKKCIQTYGEGKWYQIPARAGLNRCRKSCRLRWLNYLRPNIKRGKLQEDEVDLMLRLHKLLGNRWSLIAGRLPGRTANDIKNYWNTHLVKKFRSSRAAKLPKRHDHDLVKVNAIRPRPRTFNNLSLLRATNTHFNIDQGISWPPPPATISASGDIISPQSNDMSWLEGLLDDFCYVGEGEGGGANHLQGGSLWAAGDEELNFDDIFQL